MDKLGIFHAIQTSMCLDPHLNLFKPSCESIFTDRSGGSFVNRFCRLYSMLVCVVLSCLFLVALWSPNGLTSWLSCLLCFVAFLKCPGPHQN